MPLGMMTCKVFQKAKLDLEVRAVIPDCLGSGWYSWTSAPLQTQTLDSLPKQIQIELLARRHTSHHEFPAQHVDIYLKLQKVYLPPLPFQNVSKIDTSEMICIIF